MERGVYLTPGDVSELIGIPKALRRERGWSGARSVGMAKLMEDRIRCLVSAAQAMSAEGENSRSEVEGEARQRGPKGAPETKEVSMTDPTPAHIDRAWQEIGPLPSAYSHVVDKYARQLAHAEAEAERVRKVAEEGLWLVEASHDKPAVPGYYREGTTPARLMALFKSLLPAEPEVDPLLIEAREMEAKGCERNGFTGRAQQVRAGVWDDDGPVRCRYEGLKRGIELAAQGKVIKIEDRP